jgi:hypothetical protein
MVQFVMVAAAAEDKIAVSVANFAAVETPLSLLLKPKTPEGLA